MRAFELVSATDSQHALALLAAHGPAVKVLAGGTDLLVELKSDKPAPQVGVAQVIVDISRARDMKGIALAAEGLRIGALATHSEIMRSALVRQHCPVLATAAHTIGAVQTRNLGTLGGNLVTGVPSMDSGPALIALDASVTVAGPKGRRRMPLSDFFVGPRKTRLQSDELLIDIVVPRRNLGKPAEFLKFGLRQGQALALANVAASFRVKADHGEDRHTFVEPRVALGAVAPTVIRAPRAEDYLEGRAITPAAMAEAARIAAGEAQPIDDFRASAAYRRELIAVLTRRALENVYAHATAARAGSMA